jgi:signal transduction histidine kinase
VPSTAPEGEVLWRKDGTHFPAAYVSAPLIERGGPQGFMVLFLDLSPQLEARRALTQQAIALATLHERQLIAVDLNDRIINELFGIGLALDARARTLRPALPEVSDSLRQTTAQINRVIQAIRDVIFELRATHARQMGLRTGIELLAEELRVNTRIRPIIEITRQADRAASPEVAEQLLAIAREVVSHVLHHADVGDLSVRARVRNGRLVLSIHAVGGQIQVAGGLPSGTEVMVQVPL